VEIAVSQVVLASERVEIAVSQVVLASNFVRLQGASDDFERSWLAPMTEKIIAQQRSERAK
jgi:hypothetical protein